MFYVDWDKGHNRNYYSSTIVLEHSSTGVAIIVIAGVCPSDKVVTPSQNFGFGSGLRFRTCVEKTSNDDGAFRKDPTNESWVISLAWIANSSVSWKTD